MFKYILIFSIVVLGCEGMHRVRPVSNAAKLILAKRNNANTSHSKKSNATIDPTAKSNEFRCAEKFSKTAKDEDSYHNKLVSEFTRDKILGLGDHGKSKMLGLGHHCVQFCRD